LFDGSSGVPPGIARKGKDVSSLSVDVAAALVFPFWEEEEGEEKALALHDFERKSGFVDNLLVSPLLEKEQQSVFTAFMDDDIS